MPTGHYGSPAFDVFQANGTVCRLVLPILTDWEAFTHVNNVKIAAVETIRGEAVRHQDVQSLHGQLRIVDSVAERHGHILHELPVVLA